MKKTPCLYCQTENDAQETACTSCGMPLAKKHPNDKNRMLSVFTKAFWLITLFCIFMIFFLPR